MAESMTDDKGAVVEERPVAAAEEAILARVRMTPDERKAEDDARRQARLASLPADQRKVLDDRMAKIEGMTEEARQVYMAGRRLAAVAGALRSEVEAGLDLAGAIRAQEGTDADALAWLTKQLTSAEQTQA